MPSRENMSDGMRHRGRESSENSSDSYSPDDQLRAVERIRRCKDYYDILGVTKDAGDSELRKQYKKLALQFHPDKNTTPGAVEAFKAIGNAFAVLSDPQKRKQYDMYGLESAQRVHNYSEQSSENSEYYYASQGDISPEDLFNMFFGPGFANVGTTYVRRGNQWHRYTTRTHHTHHQEMEPRSILMQILPLLFLVSITLLSNLLVSDPAYSMQRTSKYIHERKTPNFEVSYYVKDSFESDFKGKIHNLEKQIEDEYVMTIRASCYRERNYKENMIWRAKTFKDVTLEEKARALRTPSCELLNDLYDNANRGY